jgi:hypothetical protein
MAPRGLVSHTLPKTGELFQFNIMCMIVIHFHILCSLYEHFSEAVQGEFENSISLQLMDTGRKNFNICDILRKPNRLAEFC